MTHFLKGLALLVAVACLTWVGVLWHWQAMQRDMSAEDIGQYLVALPLTLFALLLLFRWALAGAAANARQREAAAAAANPTPGTVAAVQASTGDEAERPACIRLLSAHLNCRAGVSAAAVLAAASEGQPRPDLDPELRDDDGFPLMTARIDALDVDAVELPGLDEPRPELLRALAALMEPLERALDSLRPLQHRFAVDMPDAPMLRVLASWPHDWTEADIEAAQEWMLARVAAFDVVGAERTALVAPSRKPAWLEAERLLHWLEREQRQDVLLVTACHSAVGADTVRRLAAAGRLFTPSTATQPIPGEAAAALLLAPAAFVAAPDADAPIVQLHRATMLMRDEAIDEPGRTDARIAKACIEQALASAGLPADAIGAAVHDADQHSPRAAEALTALLQGQPHLQPADDVLQTGALNGQIGVAAPLIAVALAAHLTAEINKPCLALSVDDAQQRLALVARLAETRT